ncbi:MAG: DUF1427 family protein [Pseudomonadota bacterium]
MNGKVIAGFLLAFAIGAVCRLAGLPLPAPPVFIGALLVVAMTTGYLLVERWHPHRAQTQKKNCAGPTGTQATEGA